MRVTGKQVFLVAVAAAAGWYAVTHHVTAHDIASAGDKLVSGETKADLQRRARHRVLAHTLEHAVEQYRLGTGADPTTIDDLIRQGLLEKSDRVDEWNRELKIERDHDKVVVRSQGPDGYPSKDDWTMGF